MEYKFDGEIAQIYSVNAALLLCYIWERKSDYIEANIHHSRKLHAEKENPSKSKKKKEVER